MGCQRCGSNKSKPSPSSAPSRPGTTPNVVGPGNTGNRIRDAINGARYGAGKTNAAR